MQFSPSLFFQNLDFRLYNILVFEFFELQYLLRFRDLQKNQTIIIFVTL